MLEAADYYYKLQDVIFFLENVDASVTDYRKKAVLQKIVAIVEADKNDLKNYLTGKIDTCPQIDLAAAAAAAESNASLTGTSSNAAEVITAPAPQISAEAILEQRQRHAALIDQSIQVPTQIIK